MNKTVICLLLLGLVVAALAAERQPAAMRKDKLEKMRLKKSRELAKKERTGMDKLREEKMKEMAEIAERKEAMRSERKDALVGRAKTNMREKFLELKEELKSGKLTYEEYAKKAILLKDQMARGTGIGENPLGPSPKRRDPERKRRELHEAERTKAFTLKEEMRRKKSAYLNKRNKSRRDQ